MRLTVHQGEGRGPRRKPTPSALRREGLLACLVTDLLTDLRRHVGSDAELLRAGGAVGGPNVGSPDEALEQLRSALLVTRGEAFALALRKIVSALTLRGSLRGWCRDVLDLSPPDRAEAVERLVGLYSFVADDLAERHGLAGWR